MARAPREGRRGWLAERRWDERGIKAKERGPERPAEKEERETRRPVGGICIQTSLGFHSDRTRVFAPL